MDRRITLHSQRLFEAFFNTTRAHWFAQGGRFNETQVAELATSVRQQATVMSMSDVCLILALLTVVTWFIIPLFPPKQS
jgi:N-acetylglutamate synthase-like GNAT family acetyltransferase